MIQGDGWIFVLNPRTGSRAVVAGFHDLGWDVDHVHTWPIKNPDNLPVYGVIRDPVAWIWSWYSNWSDRMVFDDWIWATRLHMFQWTNRLNAYAPVIDRYFVYENGLEHIFEHFGLPVPELRTIGQNKRKPGEPRYIPAMRERFRDEFELYESLTMKGDSATRRGMVYYPHR